MSLLKSTPAFSIDQASTLAENLYGVFARLRPLPSERDQNFLLETESGERFVLKIANALEDIKLLEAQNQAMAHMISFQPICPQVIATNEGQLIAEIRSADGTMHYVRLLSYLDGKPLAIIRRHSEHLFSSLGKCLGEADRTLASFDHPAIHRDFHWDLANGLQVCNKYLHLIEDGVQRNFLNTLLTRIEKRMLPVMPKLRKSIIHNDANDYNIIVGGGTDFYTRYQNVIGLIDFGDMVHSYTVGDIAVAIAYAILKKADPVGKAATVLSAFHAEFPLTEDEIHILFDLVCLRLCMSICISAYQRSQRPDNKYLSISQEEISATLPGLAKIHPDYSEASFRYTCNLDALPEKGNVSGWLPGQSKYHWQQKMQQTLVARRQLIGGNLSISYRQPLKIVRGWMQYLYDEAGQEYLDAYNNVPHVGHCHPRVVAAGQRQMGILNTNTRYLHDNLNRYAEKLCATLPAPLSVCFFVNSGSEANELALRLARTHTNQRDLIVLENAYHGNTTTLIDISPYKHNGPGGHGAPSWVHTAPLPDTYRGLYKANDPEAGQKYSECTVKLIERLKSNGTGLAGFIAETCPGVAGQIIFPAGYLAPIYQAIREAGGVCIADEVHTSYGRTGTHFYAFQAQGVIPDILVLGKPIGNGHPIGAVITTPEIAASFDNGMEFFSTFGGNTVSCAIGLAVLEVVESDNLQAHALKVGNYLLERLREFTDRYPIVGDIRGAGLYLGIEFVRDRKTLKPAGEEAAFIVNRMREQNILVGTDGPFHNVIKIRPPMPFSEDDADILVDTMDTILWQDFSEES